MRREVKEEYVHPAQAVFALLKDEVQALGEASRRNGKRAIARSVREAFTLVGIKPYEYKVRRDTHDRIAVVIRSKNLGYDFVNAVVSALGCHGVFVQLDPAFTPDP